MLTKISWDSGWSTSARRVAARDQLQKRHMAHLRRCADCIPRKLIGRDSRGDKSQQPQSPSTWSPELLEPGKGTKCRPIQVCLCGIPGNLNLNSLELGNALNPGPTSDSSRQSNLEPEQCRLGKHTVVSRGGVWGWWCKPSVAETVGAHASVICLQCSSLPIAQLSLKMCPPPPPCVRAEITR